MLKEKSMFFVEKAKEYKKRIHQTIMSDSLETMDETTFSLLKDTMYFIDLAIDITKEQNDALVEIDRKLETLLEKVEG